MQQYAVYHDIERRLVKLITAKILQHAVLGMGWGESTQVAKKTGGRADNPGSGTGD